MPILAKFTKNITFNVYSFNNNLIPETKKQYQQHES